MTQFTYHSKSWLYGPFKEEKQMLMTLTEFSRRVNKDKSYIHRIKKQGRLDKAIIYDESQQKDLIDFDIAQKIILSDHTLNHLKTDEFSNEDDNLTEDITYNEAKKIKMIYEAKLEKLKYEKEIEKYVDKKEISEKIEKGFLILKERLLAIPNQVSHQCVGIHSVLTIKSILDEKIQEQLEILSDMDFL